MITLKNIKKKNDIITCDAYPEDCKEAFRLTINISKKSVEEYCLPNGYDWCKSHVAMAKWHLLNILEKGEDLPKERIVMWY